jgi:large subunit ribosomal protein L10
MDRASKTVVIESMRESLSNVTSIVLANFRGLDVPTITSIRDEFRKAGCGCRVVKNTLVKIAIQGSRMEPMSALLAGPTVVIWTTDAPTAAAKIAVKYAKDQADKFVITGGFFEGQVLDNAGINQLSKMPDKPQLQASLLMTFIAAPTDFVRTIAAGPMNFMYLLAARERALQSSGQ